MARTASGGINNAVGLLQTPRCLLACRVHFVLEGDKDSALQVEGVQRLSASYVASMGHSMEFHGHPWKLYGTPRNPVEIPDTQPPLTLDLRS